MQTLPSWANGFSAIIIRLMLIMVPQMTKKMSCFIIFFPEITSEPVVDCMERFTTSLNARLSNLAKVFLQVKDSFYRFHRMLSKMEPLFIWLPMYYKSLTTMRINWVALFSFQFLGGIFLYRSDWKISCFFYENSYSERIRSTWPVKCQDYLFDLMRSQLNCLTTFCGKYETGL